MAEWLNAADCNFVPNRYVGSNPILPIEERVSFSSIENRVKCRKKKKEKEMGRVDQGRVKKRREGKVEKRNQSGKRGTRDRYQVLKEKPKRNVPQYVRGVPLRPLRTVEKALRKVYGVGRVKANELCKACGRRPSVKVGNLEVEHVQLMERWRTENVVCASDRRRLEYEAISRHLKLGTVRGMKMRRGLPVRGQRTSTNGITARRLNSQRGIKVRH